MRTPDTNEHAPATPDTQQPAESQVAAKSPAPQGVIRPTAKLYAFLGITVVILMATTISSVRKPAEKAKPSAATGAIPQEADTSSISDFGNALKHEIAEQQQKTADQANAAGPQQYQNGLSPQGAYSGVAQQSAYGSPNGGNQNPAQEQREALAEEEREMDFKSRFASNLVVSQSLSANAPQPTPTPHAFDDAPVRPSGPQQAAQSPAQQQYPAEVSVNSAVGQPYVLYEGTILDTVLMNRLDGDQAGPVKVLVTDPVYSHDRQHILIPEGSVILGESRKIGEAGFGQQRRMALVFHRLLMPDGYSVDLDRFQGLNQIGEGGIKDKVTNHYFQIFGASIALGIIGGAAELSAGNAGAFATGTDALKAGVGTSVSQSASNVLDKFLNIPPTITIREGHRIKVYISQDLLLPAVENHTIPPNI